MVANRRRNEAPIPPNYQELLTVEQQDALRKLESFGWELKFVRRPKFEAVEIILAHSDGKSFARLTEQGELDQSDSPKVRRGDKASTEYKGQEASNALSTVDEDPNPEMPDTRADFSVTEDRPAAEPPPIGQKEPVPKSTGKPPKYIV